MRTPNEGDVRNLAQVGDLCGDVHFHARGDEPPPAQLAPEPAVFVHREVERNELDELLTPGPAARLAW